MKKRIIAIATVLMIATVPAMAQIFITDDDMNNRVVTEDPSMPGAMILEQDNPNDQYLPVGEGLVVLVGLAGAYLLGKRRKEE